jgi:pilus assembly protein Flp/PilA
MRCPFNLVGSTYAWLNVDSEDGVAAIEYGVLAALIAVGIYAAAALLGADLTGVSAVVATNFEASASEEASGAP